MAINASLFGLIAILGAIAVIGGIVYVVIAMTGKETKPPQ